MSCEDFEMLMADALGDELSEADRPAFEGHLAMCERCRDEYRTALTTVRTLQSLTGADRVSTGVEHEVDRAASPIRSGPRGYSRWSFTSALRYAASVLIAFTAGYAVHAGFVNEPTVRPPDVEHFALNVAAGHAPVEPNTFGAALAGEHLKDPGRSGLAKCMIAMFKKSG